jgi:hypothetical protein
MIMDKQLIFSALQAETTQAAHISDNVVNLSHIPRCIIDNMYFVFRIGAAITGTGETLQIDLVTSAAAGLGTPQILWSTGVMVEATIEAWAANSIVFAFKVPSNLLLQYMGVIYTIAGANFSTGTWDAFLTPDAPYFIAATP